MLNEQECYSNIFARPSTPPHEIYARRPEESFLGPFDE